jgi:hypothetical protein
LLKKKITVKLIFGAVQAFMGFLTVILALLLKFNVFNIQASTNISNDALNFYVAILLFLGFVSVLSGLFLAYDWWES